MRVVAGTLGGRSLFAPKGQTVRPTPDRVREALFSALGDLEGATFLDLYAGTGAISFEAISRGAVRATAVERDKRALEVIKRNATTLDVGPRLELIASDVKTALPRFSAGTKRFDVIFADPPYAEAALLLPEVLTTALIVMAEGGLTVLEHSSREEAPAAPPGLTLERTKKYGETALAFYRRG